MKKQNVLITGGSGFIGRHLSKTLYKKYNIYVVDRKKVKLNLKNLKFFKSNISNTKLINKIISNNDIKIVIHLAAKINAAESVFKKKLYFLNNFLYSKQLFEICKTNKIKKFIFASSAAVYGNKKTIFYEKDLKKPINPYGQYKLDFEKYLLTNKGEIQIGILRFFNVVGNYPYEKLKSKNLPIISKIEKIILNESKSKLKIFGNNHSTKDGTASRDFIHVEDISLICSKVINFLSYKNSKIIVNCGTAKGSTINQILKLVERVTNKKILVKFEKKKKGDPAEVISNNNYLKKNLKFNFKYPNINKIINAIFIRYKR